MARLAKRRPPETGLPPGTLVHVGERRTEKSEIMVIDYDTTGYQEYHPSTAKDCAAFRATERISWVNVTGVHDVNLVEELGNAFDIHPLVLEDVVNTGQRPKFEDFGEYLFIVLKMLYFDPEKAEIVAEQVSLIQGANFLITFQEAPGDVFELLRERIRSGKGRIRQMGCDYLGYSLIDAILDNYFVIFEKFGENAEYLQDQLVTLSTPGLLQEIYAIKRETLFFRKCAWPLRELISALERSETSLLKKDTRIYLRDLYDHAIQIIDSVEVLREAISGMLDIYLSSSSNRMNEVMKVLTIIATIFIPLTFIAGVYGMNFQHMPELAWYWSYPIVLGIMLVVAAVMLHYFRRKGWL
jgi:magnesium transporter